MKNQSRIEKLLAELLKSSDRQTEEVKGINTRLDNHESSLSKIVTSLDKLTDVVIHGNQRADRI